MKGYSTQLFQCEQKMMVCYSSNVYACICMCLLRNTQGSLQHDYDAVLEMQLKDQELYYEKRLARETVRLLETGYAEYGSDGVSSGSLQAGSGTHNALSEEDLVSIEAMKVMTVHNTHAFSTTNRHHLF